MVVHSAFNGTSGKTLCLDGNIKCGCNVDLGIITTVASLHVVGGGWVLVFVGLVYYLR